MGAVVSVFVLAGLAAASIILWIIFAMRRRRRTQRLEHNTAVSASLAAAGLYRAPLDDDDDDDNHTATGLHHSGYGSTEDPFQIRSMSSLPSDCRVSAVHHDDRSLVGVIGEFALNPFENVDYIVPSGTREGYVSRSGLALAETGSSSHSQDHSVKGNLEPLLASYHRTSLLNPASRNIPLISTDLGLIDSGDISQLPNSSLNPIRYSSAYSSSHGHGPPQSSNYNDISGEPLIERRAASDASVYSNDSTSLDDRLDPGLRQRLQHTTSSKSDLRDDEDYSRPIFGVSDNSLILSNFLEFYF